ncbi:MAG TPA: hypothetical protein DCX32_03620 [Candidatus Moranbacteria bacterium]|nr:MAG: hypothetical protein UW95_C0017G0004 [Parcubacteria group bacterium GW2011_GWC1_45_14]HAV11604.1 hypothetical protein [Candidatus Moranbacteria bacterium]
MPLEELNRDIYDPNSDLDKRKHEASRLDPSYSGREGENQFIREESWVEEEKGLTPKQKKIVGILLGALATIIVIVGSIVYISYSRKTAFQEDRVTLSIDGPKEADSTQPVRYFLKYKNGNRVKLKDAEISLNYSENFQPSGSGNVNLKQLNANNSKIYIGDIGANEEGSVELTGVFYAPKDAPVYLHANLKYSPSNLSSEFEIKNQIGVNITTSPMFLEVAAPTDATEGDSVDYVIDYKNLDVKSLSDAQIKVSYPEGFEFGFSDPVPSQGNNVWYFGVLNPDSGGKIRISGKLTGSAAQSKTVKIQLGKSGNNGDFIVYNEREKSTKIIESALAISQEIEGNPSLVANPGDTLRYIIKYRNKGDYVLKDVIVSMEIKSVALDMTKIKLENGHFDVKTGIATWKASDIPQLASLSPDVAGEIRFSVPVLGTIPIGSASDKNFIISSIAKVDSANLLNPSGASKLVSSSELNVKLNSKVSFDTKGYYDDFKIKNSGPLPMVVGSETNFTLHWAVTNLSNDISGAKIVSSLPSGVRWTGRIYPSGEKVSYNERTNEVVWETGDVPAGTGVLGPKKEVIFQISVTPQENQTGEELKILNVSKFSAKDSFTGNEIFLEGKEKTTQLPEDASIKPEAYKVPGMQQ